MSLETYKLLHIVGVVFLFAALGGSVMIHWTGAASSERARKLAGLTHGIALLLVAFAGFGALAKLGMGGLGDIPGRLWLKMGVWALLAAAPFVLRKRPALAGLFWWLLPLLGAAAAWLAFYKPA